MKVIKDLLIGFIILVTMIGALAAFLYGFKWCYDVSSTAHYYIDVIGNVFLTGI